MNFKCIMLKMDPLGCMRHNSIRHTVICQKKSQTFCLLLMEMKRHINMRLGLLKKNKIFFLNFFNLILILFLIKSLMEFSKGTGFMFNRYVNLVLNTLSNNEHEKYLLFKQNQLKKITSETSKPTTSAIKQEKS